MAERDSALYLTAKEDLSKEMTSVLRPEGQASCMKSWGNVQFPGDAEAADLGTSLWEWWAVAKYTNSRARLAEFTSQLYLLTTYMIWDLSLHSLPAETTHRACWGKRKNKPLRLRWKRLQLKSWKRLLSQSNEEHGQWGAKLILRWGAVAAGQRTRTVCPLLCLGPLPLRPPPFHTDSLSSCFFPFLLCPMAPCSLSPRVCKKEKEPLFPQTIKGKDLVWLGNKRTNPWINKIVA